MMMTKNIAIHISNLITEIDCLTWIKNWTADEMKIEIDSADSTKIENVFVASTKIEFADWIKIEKRLAASKKIERTDKKRIENKLAALMEVEIAD